MNSAGDAGGGIQPTPTQPVQDQNTQQPAPQIIWRKGKGGKDIPYDPSKDKVDI